MLKIYITFYLFLFTLFGVYSQNLVINPSFENYKKLGTLLNPNTTIIDSFVNNWVTPINHSGTSTFFHKNNPYLNSINTLGFQIPLNYIGYQGECDSLAYVGLSLFANDSFFNSRDYIVGTFSSSLIFNQCYKVSFKYSLSNKASYYSINNFGIYFSDSIPKHFGNTGPTLSSNLILTPQIIINQWMSDTLNWVKIERYYVAQGGENFITLGNFSDANNTIFKLNYNSPFQFSHIYIDDIHVEAVPTLSLPQINLGADTILCVGEQIEFDSLLPSNPIYVWNNMVESSDSSFVIETSGTYWVEAYNGCGYSTDTIKVEFVSPKVNLGNDTILCKRQELQIVSDYYHPQAEYLWSNKTEELSTNNYLIIPDSGSYSLKVSVGHCTDTDSILVEYEIPEGSTLFSQNTDTTFCTKGTLVAGFTSWNDKYLWSTNETTQTIEITKSGTYSVEIENECTEAQSIYTIKVDELEEGLNNYNIFSPNGDFINDVFSIYEGNNEEYKITIYNRWGVQIWSTTDPTNHWKGEGVNDGTYYFTLSFRNCAGEIILKKGTVVLRR